MNEQEILKEQLKDFFLKNQEILPFISNFWKINIIESENEKLHNFEYGHFNTVSNKHMPFFKSYSRVINFSKLNEE